MFKKLWGHYAHEIEQIRLLVHLGYLFEALLGALYLAAYTYIGVCFLVIGLVFLIEAIF